MRLVVLIKRITPPSKPILPHSCRDEGREAATECSQFGTFISKALFDNANNLGNRASGECSSQLREWDTHLSPAERNGGEFGVKLGSTITDGTLSNPYPIGQERCFSTITGLSYKYKFLININNPYRSIALRSTQLMKYEKSDGVIEIATSRCGCNPYDSKRHHQCTNCTTQWYQVTMQDKPPNNWVKIRSFSQVMNAARSSLTCNQFVADLHS